VRRGEVAEVVGSTCCERDDVVYVALLVGRERLTADVAAWVAGDDDRPDAPLVDLDEEFVWAVF
jgi:hypothetical protein